MTAREYLFSLEQFGIKLGLDQIRALVEDLGRPGGAYPSILIAGTNGKGSVTAMVERALRAAGYRTGRYTSPHLSRIEERIAIDGRPIDVDAFDATAERIRAAADRLAAPPTFFEATTALALEAFRRAGIEVAVLEVGLGGRLDATNVLSPIGVAITAIDFDHEAHLGSTIAAIAREKAGIVKAGGVCVLGRNSPEVRDVVGEACRTAGAGLVYAPDGARVEAALEDGRTRAALCTPVHDYGTSLLALRGRHQIDNAVTAVRLLETLAARGAVRAPAAAIRAGLTEVDWPARLEWRRLGACEVLIDGAHNPAGARALSAYVLEACGRRVPIVFGAMQDKPLDGLAAGLAPCASAFVCTAPRSPRAASPDALAAVVRRHAPAVEVTAVDAPMAALRAACAVGAPVVVAGSLYLAGEIRAELS
jgi:dihydrofolate synthase/folylpolyglutamate synthase